MARGRKRRDDDYSDESEKSDNASLRSDDDGYLSQEVESENDLSSPQHLRVDTFKVLRDASITLPFPNDAETRLKSKSQLVTVFLDKVTNFNLPRAVTEATSNSKINARISMSLFHLETGAFYGNTWQSAPIKVKSGKSLNVQQTVCFKTKAVDASCVAVAEIIVEEANKKSGHVIRRLGCGWSMLNLFAERLAKASRRNAEDSSVDAPVFTGSPRALVFYKGKVVRESDFKPQRKCAIRFAAALHPKFSKAARLIADDEIIGANTHVPGFKPRLDAHDEEVACIGAEHQDQFPLSLPSLVSTTSLRVKQVKVMLPKSFGESITDYLRASLDVEADERKGKFVLRMGAHNGHTQLSAKGWASSRMKKAKSSFRGYSAYTTTRSLSVVKIPKDPMIALAFELGYEVPVTNDEGNSVEATIAIGSCYWLPFSGGRTYLANGQKFDAKTGMPLQLEFQLPSDNLVKSALSLPPRSSHLPIIAGIKFAGDAMPDDDAGEDADSLFSENDDDGDAGSDSISDDEDSDDWSGAKRRRQRRQKKKNKSDEDDGSESEGFSNSEDDASIDVPNIDFSKSLARRKRRMQQAASSGQPLGVSVERFPTYAANQIHNTLLAASLLAPIGPQSSAQMQVEPTAFTTNVYKPGANLTLHPQELSNNLSRASSAYLNKHGFYDVREGTSDQNKFSVTAPLVKGSIDAELADPRKVNEFTFQFAAFRVVRGVNAIKPRSVFFTFQFYDREPTRTERMKLRAADEEERNDNHTTGVSHPYILTRSKRGARDAPSLALKFVIDTDSASQNEGREFAEYLREKTLFIECWDGDSLHSLGVIAVEMASLMRQGDRSVKVAKEFDVIDSNLSGGVVDIHGNMLPGGRVVGKVQLIVSNYGFKSSSSRKRRDPADPLGNEVEASGTALTDGTNWRVKTAFGTSKGATSKRKPQYRTRARPLADTNAELGRLLKTNTSHYARHEKAPEDSNGPGWSTSDSYCLTGYEINEMIEILDEDDRGEIEVAKFYAFADVSRVPSQKKTKRTSKASVSVEKKLRRVLARAEEEGVDYKSSFAHFDKNEDGKISRSEMRKALSELGRDFEVNEEELDALLGRFDADGDGSVSYVEFVDFMKDGNVMSKKDKKLAIEDMLRKVLSQAEDEGVDLEQSFAHFDKNNDGKISRSEMRKALKELGPKFETSERELDSLLAQFDEDGDGEVSYLEFIKFAKASPKSPRVLADTSSSDHAEEVKSKLREVLKRAEDEGIVLRESFEHFDKNGDGMISRSEMQKALKELGTDFELDERELEVLFRDVCGGGSDADEVSYAKFIDFAKGKDAKAAKSNLIGDIDSADRNDDVGEDNVDSGSDDENSKYDFGSSRFRDKVKKMMRRAAKQGIDIKRAIRAYDTENCGKMGHSDFRALLMSLGVSVAESDGGVLDVRDVKDQALVERQLSRIDDLRRTRTIQRSRRAKGDDDLGAAAAHASNLDLVKRYREGQKRALVGQLLRQSLTSNFKIYPSFGKPCYFEYQLSNPYTHEQRFKIDFTDPELRIITDAQEWRYYREHVQPEIGSALGAIEDDMITQDGHVMLAARESISIPFVFMSFNADQESAASRTISISFTSKSHNQAVALLRLKISSKSFSVHRTLRFNNAAEEYLKKTIRIIPTARSSRIPAGTKFAYCTNPRAIVEWKEASAQRRTQELYIKYRCGDLASVADFYIVLYDDPYHATLHEIWRVVVQPMRSLDVHATLGQTRSTELVVRGDTYARRVRCYSSHPGEVMCVPSASFQLVAGAFNKFEILYRPATLASSTMRVHMVDVDSRELVCAWLVRATASAPVVTKTYDVSVPRGHSSHKKISYTNQWEKKSSGAKKKTHAEEKVKVKVKSSVKSADKKPSRGAIAAPNVKGPKIPVVQKKTRVAAIKVKANVPAKKNTPSKKKAKSKLKSKRKRDSSSSASEDVPASRRVAAKAREGAPIPKAFPGIIFEEIHFVPPVDHTQDVVCVGPHDDAARLVPPNQRIFADARAFTCSGTNIEGISPGMPTTHAKERATLEMRFRFEIARINAAFLNDLNESLAKMGLAESEKRRPCTAFEVACQHLSPSWRPLESAKATTRADPVQDNVRDDVVRRHEQAKKDMLSRHKMLASALRAKHDSQKRLCAGYVGDVVTASTYEDHCVF